MGTLGPGLYASDLASDLRATVRALVRLPLPVEQIVDAACDVARTAAESPEDPDHSVFWLVLADQLHGRGVDAPEVRARALHLIRSGHDLRLFEELGMGPRDLRKRQAATDALAMRLSGPITAKPPKPMTAPQPHVLHPGEVHAFPVMGRNCWNPYRPTSMKAEMTWVPDGHLVMLTLATGRLYGYLAWYAVVVGATLFDGVPDIDAALGSPVSIWEQSQLLPPWPGTCSAEHYRRLGLVRVGAVPLAPLDPALAARIEARGRGAALADISISNQMHAYPTDDPARQRLRDVAARGVITWSPGCG